MKITIIRHTAVQTEKGICYGQSDVPLAASFDKEKEVVQQKLKGKLFSHVYCSPLQRCKKLAEYLFPKAEIIFDKRLKELNFGEWENQKWDAFFDSENGKNWFNDYFHQSCPEGESYDDLYKRIQDFYAEILASDDANICVVTHGGPLKIIKALAENRSVEAVFNSFMPTYGEVINLEIQGKNE